MSNLYRVEIQIFATAYIKADSPEEAHKIACTNLQNEVMHVNDCDPGLVSDDPFDSDELPDYSLSPAMTIGAPIGTPELVEE